MPSRSRPSARPSTTSPRTSSESPGGALLGLIRELPVERLRHAFTHASWASSRAASYERLEFLGDSVLGLGGLVVIAHGNSSRTAVANAIRYAARGVGGGVVQRVADRLTTRVGATPAA